MTVLGSFCLFVAVVVAFAIAVAATLAFALALAYATAAVFAVAFAVVAVSRSTSQFQHKATKPPTQSSQSRTKINVSHGKVIKWVINMETAKRRQMYHLQESFEAYWVVT